MNKQERDELILQLRGNDIDQAVAAATRLHKTSTLEDLPKLMELLQDDDFFVREAAACPVSELAGPSSLETLLVAYQRGLDQGHDNDSFTAALIDLVEANREDCSELLQSLGKTGDKAMRENALWLLQFCTANNENG